MTGVYGGFLTQILERGQKPADYGINAVWVGSGGLKADLIARHKDLGLKVYAEFNSMHLASFLREHPDAAPIGRDGRPCPAPSGWQGVSAHHAGYRKDRMQEFARVLGTFDLDGIWLDYHHAHAAWEQAEPELPDTDFCPAALRGFTEATGIRLPSDTSKAAPPARRTPRTLDGIPLRGLHRLGARISRAPQSHTAEGPARHVPLPLG